MWPPAQSGDGDIPGGHPGEAVKILDGPSLCLMVKDLLPGLLQNLNKHDLVADHQELTAEFGRKLIKNMLDAIRKGFSELV